MGVTQFLRQTEVFALTLSKAPPGVSLTYMKVMLIYSLVVFFPCGIKQQKLVLSFGLVLTIVLF